MADRIPAEAPPSYAQATGSSASSSHPVASSSSNTNASSHLEVPGAAKGGKNGIPAAYRRSMEDEMRPLPEGWVRTYDPQSEHQFFVDTTMTPPRSIWVHPFDDDEYMNSLSGEEREHIEQQNIDWRKQNHHPSKEDMIHAHSDEEDDMLPQAYTSTPASHQELPPRPEGKGKGRDDRTFGRKLKDKVTGMTHEEREQERRERAAEEQRMYEMHVRVRQAMQRAMQTGQPQWLGKDREGKDVYIEPPAPPYAGGYAMRGGYGYSPYGQQGIYTTPNARYIRPQMPYGRPYGGGYGGGYGMPLALGGGLLGGALLGGLMF